MAKQYKLIVEKRETNNGLDLKVLRILTKTLSIKMNLMVLEQLN